MSDYVMVKVSKLEAITNRLAAIETLLSDLPAASPRSEYVTRETIMEEMEVSRAWLSGNPWALPNFGAPDIPGRPVRWYRKTWEEWKTDFPKRREDWAQLHRERRGA